MSELKIKPCPFCGSEEVNDKCELAVTHWMPLPELPKED